MSVICFSPQEFVDLKQTLLHPGPIGNRIKNTVKYSMKYREFKDYDSDSSEEKSIEKVVSCLLGHLWKSNLFVYLAQYPQEWEAAKGLNIKSFPLNGTIMNNKDLLKKLKSLDYNLDTNDGNKFIDPKWYELLQSIINTVMNELLDPILYSYNE